MGLRSSSSPHSIYIVISASDTLEVLKQLLSNYYAPILIKNLGTLPEGKQLSDLTRKAFGTPRYQATLQYFPQFQKQFKDIFDPAGKLNPSKIAFLQELQTKVPEQSLLGRMAAEFLATMK